MNFLSGIILLHFQFSFLNVHFWFDFYSVISLYSVKIIFFLKSGNNLKCLIDSSYIVVCKSNIVELRQEIVELLQFLRFMVKSFF